MPASHALSPLVHRNAQQLLAVTAASWRLRVRSQPLRARSSWVRGLRPTQFAH